MLSYVRERCAYYGKDKLVIHRETFIVLLMTNTLIALMKTNVILHFLRTKLTFILFSKVFKINNFKIELVYVLII